MGWPPQELFWACRRLVPSGTFIPLKPILLMSLTKINWNCGKQIKIVLWYSNHLFLVKDRGIIGPCLAIQKYLLIHPFFYYPPIQEYLPVLGLLTWWCASTLGATLLCSSRAGSVLGLICFSSIFALIFASKATTLRQIPTFYALAQLELELYHVWFASMANVKAGPRFANIWFQGIQFLGTYQNWALSCTGIKYAQSLLWNALM